MIAVAIIGVLASVAVPAFNGYVMASRGAEGIQDVRQMFLGSVSYWEKGSAGQGLAAAGGGTGEHCLITELAGGMVPTAPAFPPTPERRTYDFAGDERFQALSFTKDEPSHFALTWMTRGLTLTDPDGFYAVTACSGADGLAYIFYSMCDIDGDGQIGGYSQSVMAEGGVLRRLGGITSIQSGLSRSTWGACPFCAEGPD
ncbi:MAG: hypothetical protein KC416_03440 [Myxococcales bacterium]|nr:hypothetical protein [Myxococcales bacterium]